MNSKCIESSKYHQKNRQRQLETLRRSIEMLRKKMLKQFKILHGVVLFIPTNIISVVMAKTHKNYPGKKASQTAIRMIAGCSGINPDVFCDIAKKNNANTGLG